MPHLVRLGLVPFLVLTSSLAQQPIYRAATESAPDPALSSIPGEAMLAIPGLFSDFVIAGGGQFVRLPDGTARLTGRLYSRGSLFSAFLVDLELTGRVAPGNTAHPPTGSPVLLLNASAYAPAGPIDPSTFVYYAQATGKLYGTHDYDGAILDIQLGNRAAQLGHGANNRNGNLGLGAFLRLTVVQQPATPFGPLGTATLTCDLPLTRTDTATHPQVDPTRSPLPFGRALTLPGIKDDYVFVPAGTITEYEDGHAEIHGELASLSDLDDAWSVMLTLRNRIDPGQTGHPPSGSPVQQMLPGAYTSGGGVLDPASWRYYQSVSGTLAGRELNAGGSIALTGLFAMQVGGGANQTNAFHGCYCELTATVTAQPTNRTVALTGNAELFAIGARTPVLPFPTLTPPATPHTLPTLTEQGFVLTGDNLAWVELVAIGPHLAGLGGERDWHRGWIRVIDNQNLEVHPRPGLAPGVYDMRALNPAVISNLLQLTLTAPTTPTLVAESSIEPFDVLHLLVHMGQASSPAFSVVGASFTLAPTAYPGIATIGIGAQGQDLFVIPGSFGHDPVTGIASYSAGPVPTWFTGFAMHFQAVIVEPGNLTLPLPATNVWTVDF